MIDGYEVDCSGHLHQLHRLRAHQTGMRAMASLMYWVYWTPTTLPHETDRADLQRARYYSVGVAIECGLLPPGLEWTR